MKKIAFILLLIVQVSLAQEKNKIDNYTVQRLLIFNENNEVLLQNNEYGWSTPGIRNNTRQSIKESLDSLASKFGLKISEHQLKGLFTYKYEFKNEVSYRSHYSAKMNGGILKTPSDMKQAEWFSISEAIEKISNPKTGVSVRSFSEMTTQIFKFPEMLWGGSYLLYQDANGVVRDRKVLEPIYPLGKTSFETNEEDQIRTTINAYLEGTSYNKTESIKQAFYAEANLFLTHKDKKLWIVPIQEYASWFEKKEEGKFNGRIGKILSIDQENDIAMAKAEIKAKGKDIRYVDIFLLKKIEGEWKIISKAATKTN
ncbi:MULTISPECIES: nuclear transport factor 2 family protein [Aquimarina]|uniref:nuclear transport factor 2 family protein n=1 Tax=Aquimarina TaxID=290174 RepID=UPI000D68C41E|nr:MULTISPECIES: nuclear transport factor 2 family protein [Aquimarina]